MNLKQWTFIPPMKEGLPFWSRTFNRTEWRCYVESKHYTLVPGEKALTAQDPKTEAAVGMWHHENSQGVIFHDLREEGLEGVSVSPMDNDLSFIGKE